LFLTIVAAVFIGLLLFGVFLVFSEAILFGFGYVVIQVGVFLLAVVLSPFVLVKNVALGLKEVWFDPLRQRVQRKSHSLSLF
jgi:hypothetical protein